MKKLINGADFKRMIISGAAAIENEKASVNELNVFPIPDGDTGTNMALTMGSAVTELNRHSVSDVSNAADITASSLMRGARGNSGVILSLLFRGFSRRLKGQTEIDGLAFANALTDGVEAAYKAVMHPAEGTILTVSRVCAEQAVLAAQENADIEFVMAASEKSAAEALTETINQNPVLKKAGVIDAGGKGFLLILSGMLSALRGEDVKSQQQERHILQKANFAEFDSEEDIKFIYCTEYIAAREDKKRDPMRLRRFLESIGDSVVVVDDDEIIKIHVHTNNPGRAIEEGLKYGYLTSIKIDNMRQQHTQKVILETTQERIIAKPEKKYGFVAVCSGEGLAAIFKDLGADSVIKGGQTMNPSTEAILKEIDAAPAEIIFVLPNNKNIIMAAEQCSGYTDKKVIVLPTKSVPQGISAMLSFDETMEAEQNRNNMMDAISRVRTCQVTYAARDSEFDGKKIKEGEYLTIVEGQLFANGRELEQVMKRTAREVSKKEPSFITIFYGEEADESDAEKIRYIFEKECEEAEISIISGGQPIYYYLISIE